MKPKLPTPPVKPKPSAVLSSLPHTQLVRIQILVRQTFLKPKKALLFIRLCVVFDIVSGCRKHYAMNLSLFFSDLKTSHLTYKAALEETDH